MLGGLDVVALLIIDLLKGRLRMAVLAAALMPVVLLGFLLVNEGAFAEWAPSWLAVTVAWTPVVGLYAVLIVPAVRLARPASRWADRFYDDVKLTCARLRFPSDTTGSAPT